MIPTNLKIRPRSWLFYISMLFYGLQLQAQSPQLVLKASEFVSQVEVGTILGLSLTRVDKLLYGNNPAIYIANNSMNLRVNAQSAVKIITDLASVSLLENPNPAFNAVEIIEVKVPPASNLQTVINNFNWAHFQNLKIVLVSFDFSVCPSGAGIEACEKDIVRDFFQQNFSQNQYLIYSISIAD